jgi:hypothetical protein
VLLRERPRGDGVNEPSCEILRCARRGLAARPPPRWRGNRAAAGHQSLSAARNAGCGHRFGTLHVQIRFRPVAARSSARYELDRSDAASRTPAGIARRSAVSPNRCLESERAGRISGSVPRSPNRSDAPHVRTVADGKGRPGGFGMPESSSLITSCSLRHRRYSLKMDQPAGEVREWVGAAPRVSYR